MSKEFVWNGNVGQTFTSDYGSQTLTSADPQSFSRTADFAMDAAGEQLTLQPLTAGTITWTDILMVIERGTLTLDGSVAKTFLNAKTSESELLVALPNATAALELVQLDQVELGSGTLRSQGKLSILSPKTGVYFDKSTWEIDGYGSLLIDASDTDAVIAALETRPSGEGFLVRGASKLEVRAKELAIFAALAITTQDQASVRILSGTLGAPLTEATKATPFITLNGHTTGVSGSRVSIERISGQDAVDLSRLAKGKRGFNFTGNKDTNKSVLTLDFSFVDAAGSTQSGNNQFGWNWLLQNQLICVKGVPQTDNLTLTYEPTEKGLVIQFRTKAG